MSDDADEDGGCARARPNRWGPFNGRVYLIHALKHESLCAAEGAVIFSLLFYLTSLSLPSRSVAFFPKCNRIVAPELPTSLIYLGAILCVCV